MKPALLVIDFQERFFGISPETAASLSAAARHINEAMAFFREKNLPIVVVEHIDESEGLVPGSPGFETSALLNLKPEDRRIHKRYGNAFNKTELESVLRAEGVDTVIISGFCAEYCVMSTFRGAMDLDFTANLLSWTLASIVPSNIPFVERINDTVSLRFLKKVLA